MRYELKLQYILPNEKEVHFLSNDMTGVEALQVCDHLLKSGCFKNIIFIDQYGAEWTRKQMEKLLAKTKYEPANITIYFDGGYNKLTKETGVGVPIYFAKGEENYRVRANELFKEIKNNNEAEYAALYFALNIAEQVGVKYRQCIIKGDSKVVINQLRGEWPCYEKDLNSWLDRIEEKLSELQVKPQYIEIPRQDNKEAHKLASKALEGISIFSELQID